LWLVEAVVDMLDIPFSMQATKIVNLEEVVVLEEWNMHQHYPSRGILLSL
jgi:hypothetical protein